MPGNPYESNAFSFLNVPITATPQQVDDVIEELMMMIEIDPDYRERYSETEIRQARRRLEDPNQRIQEELFCHRLIAADDRDVQDLLDKYGSPPLALDDRAAVERLASHLIEPPANYQQDFADPESITIQLNVRGKRYDEKTQEDPIRFAR